MFTRIATMIAKDLRTSSRDKLTLYMLISPVLLALMLLALMPIFEDAKPQFVATQDLAALDREALAAHGELELVSDREALERRVRARDDATGVVPADTPARPGEVEVVIQGDEPEVLQGLARAILDHESRVRSGEFVAHVEIVTVGEGRTDIRLAGTALLAFTVPALISLMIGFAILEEKGTRTHDIYATSPLRFVEYFGAKLGLLVGLSMIMVVPTVGLPLGFAEVDWLAVELAVLAATPFAACYGLLVGVFAKDQLGAIALVKSLSPVWTSLPILGFVLPQPWMWTLAPFANHWAVQGFFQVLGDGPDPYTQLLWALVTGLPVFALTAWLLRRKLGFELAAAGAKPS